MKVERWAVPVTDLVAAEHFYADILGGALGGYVANRYLLTTDELLQARRVAALAARHGEAAAARAVLPYSRVLVGQAHFYLHLTDHHLQEAPLGQLRGFPRIALAVTEPQLERAASALSENEVSFEGPLHYTPPALVAEAVYFRDPFGNFLELCCLREDQVD